MKERIEFVDGSFYEFERWTADEMRSFLDHPGSFWFMNLLTDVQALLPDSLGGIYKSDEIVKFLPYPPRAGEFRTRFLDLDAQRYHKRVIAPTHAEQVMDVILTYSSSPVGSVENLEGELSRGVYLPVKHSNEVCGSLYIDPLTIVNKVLYEPSLVPKGFSKLLRERA